jgi:hypothetical protein
MKKMTKREKFEMLMAIPEVKSNPILSEFIDHELELLAKKNVSEKKPTAKQTQNEVIKTNILSVLTEGKVMTVTDLLKNVPDLPADMTNQRMSALLRQMYNKDNLSDPAYPLTRIEEKRKAYFMRNPEWDGE